MNGTQRKAKSRIAARLGLVAAPTGYVTPDEAYWIYERVTEANELIADEMETKK